MVSMAGRKCDGKEEKVEASSDGGRLEESRRGKEIEVDGGCMLSVEKVLGQLKKQRLLCMQI